jgi:surfactin synthase thioesterase subunit
MDSLMSVEFLSRVSHGLRRNLPMQALLENPAIDALADRIVREPNSAPGPEAVAPPLAAAPAAPASEAAPATLQSPWFPGYRAQPGARVRLFCFHAPGAEAAVYSGWSDVLGPDVEVLAVQLPGSGTRADEAPIAERPLLVETLAEQLLDWLDRPFAFFGHAGGGLLALDVARFVQERFGLGPARLFVAATPAPGPREDDSPGPALDCPITAFAARADTQLGHEELHAWSACTTGPLRLELSPGPTADLLAAPSPLLVTLADELRRAAEG